MVFPILAIALGVVSQAVRTPPLQLPHSAYHLDYQPGIAEPDYKLQNRSSNGAGSLFTILLTSPDGYVSAPPKLIVLNGTASQVGHAYGELLGGEIAAVYASWTGRSIQPGAKGDAMVVLIDWLWSKLAVGTPSTFLDELDGLRAGGLLSAAKRADLDVLARRLVTIANLPADSQNLVKLIEHELLISIDDVTPAIRTAAAVVVAGLERPGSRNPRGFCDFFAAWGPLTEGGRTLASRNLDFDKDTGVANHKLVTVYSIEGQHPYATFGFAGIVGALAGLSAPGIAVSEANLDNSEVSFDGIPWPYRLREMLGDAKDLDEARSLWHSHNNTAAFNFLVASSGALARAVVPAGNTDPDTTGVSNVLEAASAPGALALEAIGRYNGEFSGGSSIEASATYNCTNGTVLDGSACHWPGQPAPVAIGMPLPTAVFRTNHGLHPRVMLSQEPLWNDTVMRYVLIHDEIVKAGARESKMTLASALNITALLGQKGGDYGSCARANFKTGDASNILSVVYDPSLATALVAWEDGTADGWTPAACNPYLRLDLSKWWSPAPYGSYTIRTR